MSGLIAPAGGVWELIGEASASAVASVDFAWVGKVYKAVQLIVDAARPVTDDAEAWLRTSSDGGSSFAASASDYSWGNLTSYHGPATLTPFGDAGDVSIVLTANNATRGVGNALGEGWSGVVDLLFPSEVLNTAIVYRANYRRPSALYYYSAGGGVRVSGADVDGVRFMFQSGNIVSGEFACYGLK